MNVYYIVISTAVLIGWIGILSKKIDKNLYTIVYAVTFSLFDDILAKYIKIHYFYNAWVSYFCVPVEYLLFGLFIYRNALVYSLKKFIKASMALFFLGYFVNMILNWRFYPDYLIIIIGSHVFLSTYALIYLRSIFANKIIKLDFPIVIIVAAILFYFSFSALYFSILTYIADTPAKYLNPNVKIKINEYKPLLIITNITQYSSIAVALLISIFKQHDHSKN